MWKVRFFYMVKNVTNSLIDVLSKINLFGEEITTRGFKQKEILANQEIIEHPDERVIILKKEEIIFLL